MLKFIFSASEICGICNVEFAGDADKVSCSKCQMDTHVECSMQFSKDAVLCGLCFRAAMQLEVQTDCFKKQKLAAKKMTNYSEHLFPPIQIGTTITLAVPSVDRAPLDFHSILGVGVVADKRNDVYQIGTVHGMLKGWFNRTYINVSGTKFINLEDVPRDTVLTLTEAAAKQSLVGGQGFHKCTCRESATQCKSNRCSCLKAKVLCNSRCHLRGPCCNK